MTDELSDQALDSSTDSSPGLDTLDPTGDMPLDSPPWDGPRCEKCDMPLPDEVVSVCRHCGWYASLGTFIELDPAWDSVPAADTQPASRLQVWRGLVPAWSLVIVASVLAIVIESVVVRLTTPADGPFRMMWSLGQMAIGMLLLVGGHIVNFLIAATEDADVGTLDVVMRPLRTWSRTLRRLPARLWLVNTAACGLTAVLMSVLVIGSLPYDALFDWGFEEPKKTNLLGAMVQQAGKIPGSENDESLADAVGGNLPAHGGAAKLEDAIGDVTDPDVEAHAAASGAQENRSDDEQADDSADESDQQPDEPTEEADPDQPRPKAMCVIIGYRLGDDGQLTALVLATEKDGQLAYAATIEPPADKVNLAALAQALARTRVERPYVPLYLNALWVRPKYVCEVTYHSRVADGRLLDAAWERLHGALAQ